MSDIGRALLDRELDHHVWATNRLLRACDDLETAQFEQVFPIGLGSLGATLRHVIGSTDRWADRLHPETPDPSPHVAADTRTVAELYGAMARADEKLRTAIDRILELDALEVPMDFTLAAGGVVSFSYGAGVIHVLSHGVHHRAQCLWMLRQLGEALPELDAIEAELAKGE